MHSIDLGKYNIRTDLIIEKNDSNYKTRNYKLNDINVSRTIDSENNKYSTLLFSDITDKTNYNNVLEVFVKEIKKYLLDLKLSEQDNILIVGLGNKNSTPDALGPKVINNILVTKYLFNLGTVQTGYQNTSSFSPGVTGITGLETKDVIKSLIKVSNAKALIVIDALAASHIERVNKTIQITNKGINPGSGILNDRGELSKKTLNIPVVAIGVPTVVDALVIIRDLVNNQEIDISNYNQNSLIVTPKEIDFMIEKFSNLIATGLNISLHKNYNRQK